MDKNSKLHELVFVIKEMKLTGNREQFEQKIKPNKKITVAIEFRNTFPKNEIIKTFVIDGKEIELKYN